MIRELCRITVSIALLSCYAPSQTQTLSEPYQEWLDCDVSWLFSKAEVGPNFSLKMSFHGTPVVGTQISLSSLSKDARVVATARTDPHGVAQFKAIPPGTYDPGSPYGVLFPSGGVVIVVKGGHLSAEKVELNWPNHSIASRSLRGRLTVSEELSGPEIPLRNALVELRDVYTAKLIESGQTDVNGDYEFATSDPGIYAIRLVLPKKSKAGVENGDVAVELNSEAKEFSIPQMKVVQSDCAGVQLFSRLARDDRWEQQ